eukprot:3082356-Alexandrium_andersonii.AAC.1
MAREPWSFNTNTARLSASVSLERKTLIHGCLQAGARRVGRSAPRTAHAPRPTRAARACAARA